MFHQQKRKIDVDLIAFSACLDIYEAGIEQRYGERPFRSPEGNTIIRQAVTELGTYRVVAVMQQFLESDRFIDAQHSLVALKESWKGE